MDAPVGWKEKQKCQQRQELKILPLNWTPWWYRYVHVIALDPTQAPLIDSYSMNMGLCGYDSHNLPWKRWGD